MRPPVSLRSDSEPGARRAGTIESGLSPKLEEIIKKALEKDRKLRYQSAADIRTDLQRLKRDSDSGRATIAAERPS